jgi:hypothetical protein
MLLPAPNAPLVLGQLLDQVIAHLAWLANPLLLVQMMLLTVLTVAMPDVALVLM